MPLAGHGLRPTPLRRRASRPQLKRDPLGGLAESMYEWADVRVRFRSPEEGGPQSPRYLQAGPDGRYMPHFRVGPNGEWLGIGFMRGPSPVGPGVEVEASVLLLYTDGGVDYSPLREGAAFEILEGARVIGDGTVLRRYRSETLSPNTAAPVRPPT